MKKILRNFLSENNYVNLRKFYYKFRGFLLPSNLRFLALAYGTDKEGLHSYCKHYQNHFSPIKRKSLNILEIGVGGYENRFEGGESLKMWQRYFRKSKIYGLDIYDKSFHNRNRIKTFKGSQIDEFFLKEIVSEVGGIDIVIDDGSHINKHVIKSFEILFPLINKDAIYVIEDLQTSYWTNRANINWGGSQDLNDKKTSMNFLKGLIDCPNYREFETDNYKPSYFDENITSLHFYSKIAFIYKNGGIKK